eukprot:scaffold2281_cov19-Tisochrysis_lutea.AAC.1
MEATPAYKSVLTGKVGIRVEAEQQRAQLRDQLAQHQAAAAEAQQAAQEASAEAAAARRDDEEEVAEARAALAAREEWVASLQAEASMLQRRETGAHAANLKRFLGFGIEGHQGGVLQQGAEKRVSRATCVTRLMHQSWSPIPGWLLDVPCAGAMQQPAGSDAQSDGATPGSRSA